MAGKPQKTWKAVPDGVLHYPPKRQEKFPTRVCLATDDPKYDELPTEYDRLYDEKDDVNTLYEDRFIKITDKDVIVKRYFFPEAQSKRIPVESIVKVKLVKSPYFAPKWGIDLERMTWWAHDYLRNENVDRGSIFHVIIDNGDMLHKGLTIKNVDEFLRSLDKLDYEIEY